MNTSMLGDFSARSVGMSLSDFVYLQRALPPRAVRRRRSERRAAAAASGRGSAPRVGREPGSPTSLLG